MEIIFAGTGVCPVDGFLFLLRLLSLSYAPVSVVIILELAEPALNCAGQLIPLLGNITSLVSDVMSLAIFLLLWNAFQLLKEAEEEE